MTTTYVRYSTLRSKLSTRRWHIDAGEGRTLCGREIRGAKERRTDEPSGVCQMCVATNDDTLPSRERVLDLLADGEARTMQDIYAVINDIAETSLGTLLLKMRKDGDLVCTVGHHDTGQRYYLYRLRQDEDEAEVEDQGKIIPWWLAARDKPLRWHPDWTVPLPDGEKAYT